MQSVDFSRSFLTFRIDYLNSPAETASHEPPSTLNNARIQLECVCSVEDRVTGSAQTFVMGASCKTERVGVDGDIWIDPNADFVPILSQEDFLIIKTYDIANKGVPFYPPSRGMQPERQVGKTAEAFESVLVDVARTDAELLGSAAQIVEATLDPARPPLVARTEIGTERYTAVLEYPLKTMNASERDLIYQCDTGPVLLPDFTREPNDLITGMEMAFVAFNSPSWAEFIVRVPVPVGEEIEVYHYAKPVRYEADNRVYRLS